MAGNHTKTNKQRNRKAKEDKQKATCAAKRVYQTEADAMNATTRVTNTKGYAMDVSHASSAAFGTRRTGRGRCGWRGPRVIRLMGSASLPP